MISSVSNTKTSSKARTLIRIQRPCRGPSQGRGHRVECEGERRNQGQMVLRTWSE